MARIVKTNIAYNKFMSSDNPEVKEKQTPEDQAEHSKSREREGFGIPVVRWGVRKPCVDIISEFTTDPAANNRAGFRPDAVTGGEWPYEGGAQSLEVEWHREQVARKAEENEKSTQNPDDTQMP